ncbi:rod-determining factor RdfA [Natronoarchaeum sp. GCM10025321]|uniref:rod-determining factor RdfA n=1 Tax=Natronoarchaeum sp. GCM10025321 TaxID=3252684 RepID=UPI00360FF139
MTAESDPICKVDRISNKWELAEIDERLQKRRNDGDSLRDLETYYNQAVLQAAMKATGQETLDGEIPNVYRLLTDDEVSPGERIDVESRLRQNGLDPAELTGDFVSYQTIRTHLNDCLEVDTARDTTLTVSDAQNTVFKLISRTESVAHQMIARLETGGSLTIPAPTVTLSLRVGCSECGDEYPFSKLLERGGCSCQSESRQPKES